MVFLMTIFFPLWRIFTVILITGTEGFDFVPSVAGNGFGRYEIGLLCLGMMQFHFGHPKMALEVLTEAVRVSQQQLFVLLRGSLKRTKSLKLKRLVASNHLAMAKFDLTVMKFST
ncbi:anaphase-promoting complex subunit 5-like isoform X3 [Vigna radiata var. radiata]|uniref:Anaphase-promoting complex subunit 5 n=1 Tax=Vigna radiata var. radiata TaxID=3916 RepID=A0A3Q0EML4_VIGRR|nr:anaphase-promoting complex subunit 5-like isoform X3 [Vigna radiata var. radiata]